MIYPFNLRSRVFYAPLVLGSLVATFYLIGIIFNFLGNFSNIFFILIAAWFITISLRPFVNYLKNHGMTAEIAIILSFIVLLIVIVALAIFVFPSIYSELNTIAQRISSVDFNNEIDKVSKVLQLRNINVADTIVSHVNQFVSFLLSNSVSVVGNIFTVLLDIVLAFFFAFYFLLEGHEWKKKIQKRVPDNFKEDFGVFVDAVNEGIQGFIKGQTIIALVMALCIIIIMKILGLNLIAVAGLYVFICMYLPVLGPPISAIFPLIVAATTSFTAFLILLIAILIVSQLVTNILQPKIFSKSLGIHPVLVVLAVLIGAQLFGLGGALLALPAASIIQSLLLHYYK